MAAAYQFELKFTAQMLELINGSAGRGGPIRTNIDGQGKGLAIRMGNGTGTNQVDLGYWRRTPTAIAASGNLDFDLSGSLTNSFGTTIAFAKIVGIFVFNWNTAGTLTFKIPAANGLTTVLLAASDGIIIGPAVQMSGVGLVPGFNCYFAPAGRSVTAGTVDLINLLNDDGTNAADYSIGLIGRSA
jgi:hypothetical protein